MTPLRLFQKSLLALGLACAASAALAATTGADATMTIGIGTTLNTLDPAQQNTTTVRNVLDYEVETLATFNEQGKLQPLLATAWDWSDGGKVLTVHLREGVKFHDGTPFDAEAAKFSLGRLITPKVNTPNGQRYKVMDSIEAVDPHTIAIHLKHPVPDFPLVFGDTVAAMIAPSSVGKDGNTYENIQRPIGTGPYRMVRYTRGSRVDFKRFDGYWGKKPYYANVVIRIVPEAAALEAGLRAGQLDLIMNPPASDLQSLAAAPGIAVLKVPSDRVMRIQMVTNKPPLENKKVRQALNYAVDKQAIIKNVMFDAVTLSDSPFAPSIDGYCKAGSYAYDPAKAKQLLKEAGAEHISLIMGTPRGRYVQDFEATQAVASYLRKVGIKVEVQARDWASFISATGSVDGNPFNLSLGGWAPPAMDALTEMQIMSEGGFPPHGMNGTFFVDPEIETLFAQAKTEPDKTARDDLYCQIQKRFWDDAPWLFLWTQNLILAYNKAIEGISYQPNEKFVTIYAHPKP